jgi:aryl-alcohol dehydrogenase-like predicted oxidoreductase
MRMLWHSGGSVIPDNIPAAPGMPAAARGVSPQRVTLAWMLAKAPVVIPVPGASRPESIIDSAQAPELVLSPGELARLDESRS